MAKSNKKNSVAYRKNTQNRFSMLLILLVLVVVATVVGIRSYHLVQSREVLQQELQEVLAQQEAERVKAEEIEEYEKYTKTQKFAEEKAKEDLGLVHEDEIILKKKED